MVSVDDARAGLWTGAELVPEGSHASRHVKAFNTAPHRLYIGGDFLEAQSGATYRVIDPATEATIAHVADAGADDVDRAVRAARTAFDTGAWPAHAASARGRLLWRLADLIEANADELVLLETLDSGMPMAFARAASISRSAAALRYNAGWADKLFGETIPIDAPNQLVYTRREPVGVVGAIISWNVPLINAVSKLAPALAAGCTMVLKVSEQTPLTALRLAQLVTEAGFPAGVFNLLTSKGRTASLALVDHPMVDKIAFTGSTAVGKQIMAAAASTLKRISLELGGKSPVIILPGANVERAAAVAAAGIFANAGQVCIAGSRLFVHRSLHDQVLDAIVACAEKLRVGSGLHENSEMGPLISRAQMERVLDYIDGSGAEGVETLTGGKRIGEVGYFVAPTVLRGGVPDARVLHEEIFGPVLCASMFEDEDLPAVAAAVNQTSYGLSASVWTQDIGKAHHLARLIKAGTVRINGGVGFDPAVPFGGYKESGIGRENGSDGVKAYTEVKAVTVAL